MSAPVSLNNGRGREKMKLWNDVNKYLRSFKKGSRIVLIRYMNGRVGSNEVAGVVGKSGIDGINQNGEHLVHIMLKKGCLANTFQHKLIHRYTWRKRDKRGEQKSMIDYTAVIDRLKSRCWMQRW